ncbi:MAG: metallophosphoesterase [Sphingomicrobium sp.]|nr:metallophosphoesterase [Sphingomonadales bacterium]
MARLIHLSDLHFGAHDPVIVEAVERRIDEERPDLVVISGDFTQRARTEQFKEACRFLERLSAAGHEVLAVPGNHDVPLYDVLRRFLSPLTRYKRYVSDVLCPFIEVPGASVLGINTARSATFKGGRINEEQIAFIRDTFAKTTPDNVRVLVTHHPLFAQPVGEGLEPASAVENDELALSAIAEAGVDLLLAGHNHRAWTIASELAKGAGRALVIQAGTATSTRVREEGQSFNLIVLGKTEVEVTLEQWDGSRFVRGSAQRFARSGQHWELAGGEPVAEAATNG